MCDHVRWDHVRWDHVRWDHVGPGREHRAQRGTAQRGTAQRGTLGGGARWAAGHCAVGGLWDDSERAELRQLAVGGVQPPARSQVVAWLGQSPTSEPATGRSP